MLQAIRGIRPWQIAVLAVALVVGIGGSYAAYRLSTQTDDAVISEEEQLYTISAGDLIEQVKVSGSLSFPDRDKLSFGADGTISQVLVEEGDMVAKGQKLAILDEETVATLEKAVAEAEVNLRDAREALDEALNPHTALQLAQAEADVAQAQVDLESAENELATLMKDPAHDLAEAAADVAAARLAVASAADALETAQAPPSAHDLTLAESKITDARVEVDQASRTLNDLLDGPEQDELENARSTLDSARNLLTAARLNLALTEDDWKERLDKAADTLKDAQDDYADVFLWWTGIELTETERSADVDALLDSWNVHLTALFTRSPDPDPEDLQVPTDNPATRWHEPTVYLWANFFPGSVLVTCAGDGGKAVLTLGERCMRKEMDDAWNAIDTALEGMKTTESQKDEAVLTARSTLIGAGDDLADAEKALADLMKDPDTLDVEAKRMALKVATSALREAEKALADLMKDPDPLELEDKEKKLALAQANLDKAEDDLADLMKDPDPLELAAARKNADLAAAKLASARQDLADMRAGADRITVSLKEADVAALEAALASARNKLDKAELTAPWDGVISSAYVEEGQHVGPDTDAFEIVDQTVVEVDGQVDEIDVLFVREGSSASVTMDALPEQTLSGVVSEIASDTGSQDGGVNTRVVRYAISIRVEPPPGMSLPEGLSALASVTISEDRNVLLVPLDAVYGSFNNPTLRVMKDGVIEERSVSLGNSDDFWVVVEDGISEGDVVVMQYREQDDPFGGFGGFGGIVMR